MIDPTIKIKEKKNSYSVKAKISKEEIEDYLTPEGIGELKKDFLNIMALEFDRFILEKVEEEGNDEVTVQVDEILQKINVTQDENELSLDEEEETEEVGEEN